MAWKAQIGQDHQYLDEVLIIHLLIHQDTDLDVGDWFIQLLTYWVAYSHMIPISLYVCLEMLKMAQGYLINKDEKMYDPETLKYANCKTTDLIEELGQVKSILFLHK